MITTLSGYIGTVASTTMTFGELAIGARFEFRGRRYEKVAPEVGRDEERCGNMFHRSTEVVNETEAGRVRSLQPDMRQAAGVGIAGSPAVWAARETALSGARHGRRSESPMQRCWG